MNNCLYLVLAYFLILILIILLPKRPNKTQFLKSVSMQTLKNLWMVPAVIVGMGIAFGIYGYFVASKMTANFLDLLKFGAVIGVPMGLAIAIGEAGRKFGMKW